MFNRTVIINLARREDKRQNMVDQMDYLKTNNINMNHEFFVAIDGNNNEELQQFSYNLLNWSDPNSGKSITRGEVGCALSHYSVWKKIVDDVQSGLLPEDCKVLILEDDVVFGDVFVKKCQEYLDEITNSYDMIYIHRKPFDIINEVKITPHISKALKSYWLCAYVLTYSGARKLVNSNFLDALIPVDEFVPIMYGSVVSGYNKYYEKYERLHCLAMCPSIVRLTSSAFYDSETFHSNPPEDSYNDEILVIYHGSGLDDGYTRLVNYCQLYGMKLIKFSECDSNYDIQKYLIDLDDPDKLIIVIINTGITCNIFPVGSPSEISNIMHNMITRPIIGAVVDNLKIYISTAEKFITVNDIIKGDIPYVKDARAKIMLNVTNEDSIVFNTKKSRIISKLHSTTPCILYSDHNNVYLNQCENYTGRNWNEYYGYCPPKNIHTFPRIYIALNNITISCELDYPQELLFIDKTVLKTDTDFQNSINNFKNSGYDYYFYVSEENVLTNPNVLHELLESDKSIIAPILVKPDSWWTNFWGDLKETGFYKRSHDYKLIIDRKRTGCWNVPYINGVFLVNRNVFNKVPNIYLDSSELDIDMRFCKNLRDNGVHMYAINSNIYGYIGTSEKINSEVTLFDVATRQKEWEKKYLHPKFNENLSNLQNHEYKELCDGIYSFPLFSETFCQEIIQLSEKTGGWSGGKDNHADSRLGQGYYENVPTVDIQLFQMKLDQQWNFIVRNYIAAVARVLYNNYKTKDVNLAFVVKYDVEGQQALSPHHDASTYTVNIALNRGDGIDYNGGGCRFVRQNFVLKNQPVGTCSIHPGRLTAYHEGLPVTEGTRFILVSFIN
jgi:GR25 family glycosyltransferase involved in LPS biosynthesis